MKLVENVPDHILKRYMKPGQTITILKGARVHVLIPALPSPPSWEYDMGEDTPVKLANFLPGYTEVYTPKIHNHQVVWVVNSPLGNPWQYHSTDINNVKEIREAT